MATNDPTVTLAHGDGVGATLRFVRQEILSRFGNPVLNAMEDASWLTVGDTKIAVTTDSYIVDPPEFPGGDIGKLAISGTVNDLLASGAVPRYLSFSLIIAEGFSLPALRRILDSARLTALEAGVEIVAGDTKVINKQSGLGLCINTTGFGTPISPDKDYSLSRAGPGDKIIVTGSVGDHGLAVLSAREGLGFERRIGSDCAPLHEMMIPLLRRFDGINALRDPTRGGLLGVLFDIVETTGMDVVVDEEMIPIKREVCFGCEMLGIDPLQLVNEGKMVVVVTAEQAGEVNSQLRQHPLGSHSQIIGTVQQAVGSQGRVVLRKDQLRRVAVRPEGQNMPRLC